MEVTQSKTELSYLTRSLLHHPSPYIIYELDGSIAWANMAARYIFDLKELGELSIDKIDDEIKNNFGDINSIALYYDTPIEVTLRNISFFMRTRVHMIPVTDESGIMLIELLCQSRDGLDALNWVESIGGTKELIKISNENLKICEDWISKSENFKFMCSDKNLRSSTSITILIKDEWFNKFDEEKQRETVKKIVSTLKKEDVANDINGYAKRSSSFHKTPICHGRKTPSITGVKLWRAIKIWFFLPCNVGFQRLKC